MSPSLEELAGACRKMGWRHRNMGDYLAVDITPDDTIAYFPDANVMEAENFAFLWFILESMPGAMVIEQDLDGYVTVVYASGEMQPVKGTNWRQTTAPTRAESLLKAFVAYAATLPEPKETKS
jgi:hypothetical protein